MCRRRNFHLRGVEDTNGSSKDVVSQFGKNGTALHQIDLAHPQHALQVLSRSHEPQQSHGPIKLHQQIDFALVLAFVTRHRTKQRQ